ncbi:hypothetical protein AB0J63_33400 [Streptosporangium canum]
MVTVKIAQIDITRRRIELTRRR